MNPTLRIEREFITKGRATASARQSNCCKYCFEPFTVSPATAEHRVPRSKGGSNLEHNIDAACGRCNKLKGSMTAGQFVAAIKSGGGTLEMMLAWSRRRIWIRTHRACRDIGRAVGFVVEGPIGRKV